MAISHDVGPTDVPLITQTIGANLDATVARFGDREAMVDCAVGKRWTYAEFARDVDALARGFLGLGVAKGDRVGIWAPNCAEWTLVQYATAKIGAILVNINPAYRTHELQYVLNQAGIHARRAPSFKTSDYAGMIEEVRSEVPTLTHVVLLGRTSPGTRCGGRLSRSPGAAARARSPPGSRPTTRSTSNTPRAQRDSPRARRSATRTSSTTASSSARSAATPRRTGSASRCPSTTASAWSWATSRPPRTGPAWSSRRPVSTRR
jgi:acyl-CoA synthetase (AMP-forming)/AMP-acid ligase II